MALLFPLSTSPGVTGIQVISWKLGTSWGGGGVFSFTPQDKCCQPKGNGPGMGTRGLLLWNLGFCPAIPKSPFLKWMWDHWKYTGKCSCEIKLFRTKEIVLFKGKHLCEGIRLIWFFTSAHLKWCRIKKTLYHFITIKFYATAVPFHTGHIGSQNNGNYCSRELFSN